MCACVEIFGFVLLLVDFILFKISILFFSLSLPLVIRVFFFGVVETAIKDICRSIINDE